MIFTNTITTGAVIDAVIISGVLWFLFHRLATSLRGVVRDANDSIAAVHAALTRIETLETRLNATEHRLAVIERWQIRALDAEATAKGAGISIPPLPPADGET